MAASNKFIKTIFGSMECGRGINEPQSHGLLKEWIKQGYNEIDTALMYCNGKTEKIIGKLQVCRDPKKALIACKANPHPGFTSEGIVKQLASSLDSLQVSSCDIFYLHWPDYSVDIEDTLKGVNQLHKDTKFVRFGLSNYSAWQVMEIYNICKTNGYVLPTVYQGMYNALTRDVEIELLPCLRRLGIAFYAYNPLAGGILSGKHMFESKAEHNIAKGRFQGQAWDTIYQGRFWKKSYFDGVDIVKEALNVAYPEKEPVTVLEASFRWLYHHSKLNGELEDGVILGPSKIEHFQPNIDATKQGPLAQGAVEAFEEAWRGIKSKCPVYYR